MLSLIDPPRAIRALLDQADLERKVGRLSLSHELFQVAGEEAAESIESARSFGRVKLGLAEGLKGARTRIDRERFHSFLSGADQLFRRATILPGSESLRGWAWFDLARTLKLRKAPKEEVSAALQQAASRSNADSRLKLAIREL